MDMKTFRKEIRRKLLTIGGLNLSYSLIIEKLRVGIPLSFLKKSLIK